MKKGKTHLQTSFIKYILEKYSKNGQSLPDEEEIEIPEDENETPPQKRKKIRPLNEFEDDEEEGQGEDETTEEEDDEIIDELLNEYKRLKKRYESNRIRVRRKR